MTEYKVLFTDIDREFDETVQEFMGDTPGLIPYGPPIFIASNNEYRPNKIMQSFVKYDSKLNDKFLEELIDELKFIPEFGSAYIAARERYNEKLANVSSPNGQKSPKSPKSPKVTTSRKSKGGKNKKTKKNRKNI
jgi:hypothetical protein